MKAKLIAAWEKIVKPLLIVVLVIGGGLWGIYWVASVTWDALAKIDEKFAVTLVMAVLVASGSIIGILISKHLDRKHKVEADLRDKKVQFYQEFTKRALYGFFGEGEDSVQKSQNSRRKRNQRQEDDITEFLRGWKGKLIVYGGPEVVASYIKMEKGLQPTQQNEGNVLLYGSRLICDVLLAIRKDLGLSNHGLDRDTFLQFILRDPKVVDALIANPDLTLDELQQVEAAIDNNQAT